MRRVSLTAALALFAVAACFTAPATASLRWASPSANGLDVAAAKRARTLLDDNTRLRAALLDKHATSPHELAHALLTTLFDDDTVSRRLAMYKEDPQWSATQPVSPYWRFIPLYEGSAALGGAAVSFSTACFRNVTVTADPSTSNLAGELLGLTLTATDKVDLNCMSEWFFTTASYSTKYIAEVETPSQRVYINVTGISSAERYLMQTNGVRVHTTNATDFEGMASLLDTLVLFLPKITGVYDPVIEANNMAYINTFAQFPHPVQYRPQPGLTGLDESEISDGDLLFVSDMTGLGTSIQLGTGGSANHVATCLRDDQGVLQVCESTDPNIICTPYLQWISNAAATPRSVVLAPLGPQYRANFNRSAAWAFINSTLGFEYGYYNFLMGWIDTADRNWPCMPPDFQRCLRWEFVEYFVLLLDKLLPSLGTKFFGQALNHRVNTTGLTVAETLQVAQSKGMTDGAIMAIPEQDAWVYATERYGKPAVGISNVCSSHACHTLKMAGAFAGTPLDGTLQCTEQTPWNMLALSLWDPVKLGSGRPAVCQQRDPANLFCQLSGHTTFNMDIGPNAKPLTPHSGENCPGINPLYDRPASC